MSDENTQAAPATEGQVKQIVRIIQDAFPDTKWIEELLARLGLDKDGAQMLIESGNALHEVRKFLADKVKELSNSNLYADQVVTSKYGYLSGYRKARPMDERIAVLRQYDWGRDVDWTLNEQQQQLLAKPVPQGSEGYFAVVFDQTMGIPRLPDRNPPDPGPTRHRTRWQIGPPGKSGNPRKRIPARCLRGTPDGPDPLQASATL